MGADGKIVGASKVTVTLPSGSRRNFLFSIARQNAELIAEFREHLKALRRERRDVADHITSSREAIEHSIRLLRLAGKIEAELS
jgi:hypothetical protein